MPYRLILKVTKFQLSKLFKLSKRLSTVVKNIVGDHQAPSPMSNRVKVLNLLKLSRKASMNDILRYFRTKRNNGDDNKLQRSTLFV